LSFTTSSNERHAHSTCASPSFVLGRAEASDPSKVCGAKPFADFKAEIDSALAQSPQ